MSVYELERLIVKKTLTVSTIIEVISGLVQIRID